MEVTSIVDEYTQAVGAVSVSSTRIFQSEYHLIVRRKATIESTVVVGFNLRRRMSLQ